ncbi:MAG: hypothetical protein KDE51_23180 [Anaerolineales bacterium]|nr:hypothetical protein [Anaerolineales bacterium]
MSRTDWFLGLALIIVLAAVAFLGIFFWQQSRLELPSAETALAADYNELVDPNKVSGKTAIVAYGLAQNHVNKWQDDAQLISATATWPPNLTIGTVLVGAETWSFTFYSPSVQEAVNVSVTESNATLGQSYAVQGDFQPIGPSAWKVNSDEAITIFMSNGGNDFFVSEQDVLLTTQLTTVADSKKLEWLIAAISDKTGHGLTIIIDGATGEVLDIFRDS